LEFIGEPSKIQYVSPGDITIVVRDINNVPQTVRELMDEGTSFFEAIYYVAAEVKTGVRVVRNDNDDFNALEFVTSQKVDVFCAYLLLMIRANWPSRDGNQALQALPRFLTTLIELQGTEAELAGRLAGFNLNKIPKKWIRLIPTANMAQEVQQRLGLGLAGYRQLSVFKLFTTKPDISPVAAAAVAWVRQIANEPMDREIHPATRSPALINAAGPFAENLYVLIFHSFSAADQAAMVTFRFLPRAPADNPRFINWKGWGNLPQFPLASPIF
jgi:hypothetical protein